MSGSGCLWSSLLGRKDRCGAFLGCETRKLPGLRSALRAGPLLSGAERTGVVPRLGPQAHLTPLQRALREEIQILVQLDLARSLFSGLSAASCGAADNSLAVASGGRSPSPEGPEGRARAHPTLDLPASRHCLCYPLPPPPGSRPLPATAQPAIQADGDHLHPLEPGL